MSGDNEQLVSDFSSFGLHERVLKALAELNIVTPTPVQSRTINAALSNQDLLVSAETGSGKTAAFLLPVLHRLVANPAPNTATRALILLPTRELARQVFKHFSDLSKYTQIQAGLITGGADLKYQAAVLRKNPEIVIATPGRIVEHLSRKSIDLSDLEVLVLDEADRMLDLGLGEEVLSIAAACKPEHQALLYSATLRHKGVRAVAHKVLKQAQEFILNENHASHSQVRQQIVLADDDAHKQKLLSRLLEIETYDKAIVFANTRDKVTTFGHYLSYKGIRCAALHGEMEQVERNRVMDLLRRGQIDVLIATDVAARGLDVKGVDLVINVDMTRNGDDHVHRVGRTGRAGEVGLAISMVTAPDWNLMSSIERYLKINFERREVKGLEGKYKGPKKLKASGKAAGTQKRKQAKKDGVKKGKDSAKQGPKVKQRLRDQKTIGKRRKPSEEQRDNAKAAALGDGFSPLKKAPSKAAPGKKKPPIDDDD